MGLQTKCIKPLKASSVRPFSLDISEETHSHRKVTPANGVTGINYSLCHAPLKEQSWTCVTSQLQTSVFLFLTLHSYASILFLSFLIYLSLTFAPFFQLLLSQLWVTKITLLDINTFQSQFAKRPFLRLITLRTTVFVWFVDIWFVLSCVFQQRLCHLLQVSRRLISV